MALLEFARGPALSLAMAVFLLGTVWRIVGIVGLRWDRISSDAREGAPSYWRGALSGVVVKMWPHAAFRRRALFSIVNGYVFHVGLAIAVFLFAPHILVVKSLFGLSWPALPSNVIYAVSVVVAVSLLAALVHRLTSPVLRLISRPDDYISWAATMLPVLTGLAAASHIGARYETLLAVHILSICLFLIWFPFGKLMHAFLFVLSRGATGARLSHRGAQV